MNKKIGIVASNKFFDHCIDQPVKESPRRLHRLYANLKRQEYQDFLLSYPPLPASDDELQQIFSSLYLDQLRHYSVHKNHFAYDKDTYLMESSVHTARLALGGCLGLANAIMTGEIDCGFALIRPPGHHAEQGRGMGYCIFNNIATVAQHLLNQFGFERILIFDFDAHHGNGTQNWFYHDKQVLTISIHQRNLFPANSGSIEEFGEGEGLGYNINIPVKPTFGNQEYNCLTGRVIQEIIDQFMPQIILVAAGFDGHRDDSMSGLNLTTGWFNSIAGIMKYFANEYCGGKLMYVLEGGYNAEVLDEAVLATLKTMYSPAPDEIGFCHSPRALDLIKNELLPVLSKKWAL